MSLSKRSVDPAHRGRRYWAKGDVLKLPLQLYFKTTLYHKHTNHSKTEQTNQSVSSIKIYLIAWIRKGMKSLKHPGSMYKYNFHSTTQGKGARG